MSRDSVPASKTSSTLNLGCGTDIRPGCVNLDVAALPGVDVVHDLNVLPLPFGDAAFEEIVCQDVLEHVDFAAVLQDLHRILRPGGVVRIRSPHFTSAAVYVDPTHRTAFSIETFDFFAANGAFGARSFYFDFVFERIADKRITFHRYRLLPWNYIIEPLVNSSPAMQRYYESTFLARAFPAANVELTLVK